MSRRTITDEHIDAALDALDTALVAEPSRPYFERHRRRYRHDLRAIASLHAQGELLEVGALPCHISFCLRRLELPAIGVDLAPERMMGFIERHALSVSRCDIERERLPFDGGRFSLAVLTEVFEHLRIDPLHALDEIHRVLAPGGTFFVSTPNLYSLRNIVSFARGRGIGDAYSEFEKLRSAGHMGHIREYTAAEVSKFLERSGFSVREVGYAAHEASYLGKGADLIARFLPKVRPYLVITASKR